MAVFGAVIAALSLLAYFWIIAGYRDLLAPVLGTPEGSAALSKASRAVAASIVSLDFSLLLFVGAVAWVMARAAVRPLEAAREREERFAADAAHELRTPLTAIAGIAQNAGASAEGLDRAAFDAIASHALEASALVGDLLTLARTGDRRSLVCEPVDLSAVVSRETARLAERARERGVSIDVQAVPAIVDGDAARLREVAVNLLDNALRHAVHRIDVRVAVDGSDAVFSVDDDGPGVPASIRKTAFERFTKGEGSAGTGLGLAISRWIVTAHGGSIALSDGSRFTVRLPRIRAF